jgi:hypothetical protein
MQLFHRAMGPIEAKMPIAGIYDFTWLIEKAQQDTTDEAKARAVFVDVGAGKGQAIVAIRKEFPGLPLERIILQDRPEVVEAVKKLDDENLRGVQTIPIDFHKAQPVKGMIYPTCRFSYATLVANTKLHTGAHVYWIRRCLHNYPDGIATNILRIVADAAAPDSKILLQEDVISSPPHNMAAMLDIMMLGFGGKQRTLDTWKKIADDAGLEITSVSRGKGPWIGLSVLECVKKTT